MISSFSNQFIIFTYLQQSSFNESITCGNAIQSFNGSELQEREIYTHIWYMIYIYIYIYTYI